MGQRVRTIVSIESSDDMQKFASSALHSLDAVNPIAVVNALLRFHEYLKLIKHGADSLADLQGQHPVSQVYVHALKQLASPPFSVASAPERAIAACESLSCGRSVPEWDVWILR